MSYSFPFLCFWVVDGFEGACARNMFIGGAGDLY